jgi:hypothetical protein
LTRAGLLTQERLQQALASQRARRLGAIARARTGELFFVDDARSGETLLGKPDRPLAMITEALRAAYSEAELLALLGGLDRISLEPTATCAALRSALCFSGDEAYAFDLCLRGVAIGLVLREARARAPGALAAAAFAIFVGLSANALTPRD